MMDSNTGDLACSLPNGKVFGRAMAHRRMGVKGRAMGETLNNRLQCTRHSARESNQMQECLAFPEWLFSSFNYLSNNGINLDFLRVGRIRNSNTLGGDSGNGKFLGNSGKFSSKGTSLGIITNPFCNGYLPKE